MDSDTDADAGDDIWVTYSELGSARGIDRLAAKRLAMRRKWRRTAGNDGHARILVPRSEMSPAKRHPDADTDVDIGHDTDVNMGGQMGVDIRVVTSLETAVSSLTARAEVAERRADAAEGRADKAEARTDRAEAEREALRVELAATKAEMATERDRADRAEATVCDLRQRLDEQTADAEHARAETKIDAEGRLAAEMHATRLEARALQAEGELAGERIRVGTLSSHLEGYRADLEQARREARDQAAELCRELEAAQMARSEAEADAAEIRQAETARKGRGRWARLRAAWRGE